MRKNLISIIILAICIVNLVLNALMVFVFVPAIKKTDNLVTEIAAILNLELEKDETVQTGPSIEDVQTYNLSEATTINLKNDGTNIDIKYKGKKLPTGMRKMGSVIGDSTEIGCNSVLYPGTIIGKNTNIYPLTRVRGIINSNSIVKDENTVVEKENR